MTLYIAERFILRYFMNAFRYSRERTTVLEGTEEQVLRYRLIAGNVLFDFGVYHILSQLKYYRSFTDIMAGAGA